MLQFADRLRKADMAPEDVNVILHSPVERDLQAVLPTLFRTRRDAFEAYQATHAGPAESTLSTGRRWLASFVTLDLAPTAGRRSLIFAGMCRNNGWRARSQAEIASDAEVQYLRQDFGAYTDLNPDDADPVLRWFDLRLDLAMAEWQGRVIIAVRLTPAHIRVADSLDALIAAFQPQSRFAQPMPHRTRLALSTSVVRQMAPAWGSRLREWRGIYITTDTRDGARYVGSAYGADNTLDRWQAHVARETGATAQLIGRDPDSFRFSILERVSPDMPPQEVISLENSLMDRLGTREWGLNS